MARAHKQKKLDLGNKKLCINEELYQKALAAVNELFSDMSVDKAKTRENLQGLTGEIEILYNTLRHD